MLLEFGVFSLYFGVLGKVIFSQLANLHVFRGELFHENFDLLPKGDLRFCDSLSFDCNFCGESVLR